MGDVELEAPELDDVDEEASRFKKLVALGVVLITLFGAVVAFAQSSESNIEDEAARDAQRFAISGLGDQVDASAALAADLRIGSAIDAVVQREALNAARVQAITGDADSDAHLAARERLAAVAAAVADLTPVDPADEASAGGDIAEQNRRPDQARLRQTIEADLANDHGSKADSYVAVLTVLAVALFLLGLSLTVEGRNRFVLVAPGLLIAVVCLGAALQIRSRHVTDVSPAAIDAAAQGQALQDTGDLEGAIQQYTEAIVDSPDFAAAYARRASARFLQGSTQSGQTDFVSLTSDAALEDALDDLEEALDRGATTDVVTVSDAGFFHFLAGDWERSVELTTDAIDLNDQLASLWFNLGVAELAQLHEDEAVAAYEEGLDVLRAAEPSAARRSAILSGARTDLSILRDLVDDDDRGDVTELIEPIEARLAQIETRDATCSDGNPCSTDIDASDATLGDAEFSRNGAAVFVDVPVDGLADGDAVGVAWYFRTSTDVPFEQAALGFEVVEVSADLVSGSTLPVLTPACPVVGDYLVRLYAGDEFLGEAAATIGEAITPADIDDDGVVGSADVGRGTPLGATFTGLADPVEGFEACVPDGFRVDEADISDLDAFTAYGAPDGSFLIGVNVTPGSLLEGQSADDLEEILVESTVPGADTFAVSLQARDLEGGFVFLEGTAAIGEVDGIQVATVVASGPDGASRTILLTADADFTGFDEALLLEVAGTVTFTGVDTGSG